MEQEEYKSRTRHLQRVVQLWTLMDDENYAKGEPRDVELAIRIIIFHLTHVYWA